jgi:hypothetical protein
MSDIFWIEHGEIITLPDVTGSSLRQGGVQPVWVQVTYWIGEPPAVELPGRAPLFYCWPAEPGLAAFLLQDALHVLKLREHHLVTLVEEKEGRIDQAVLASPRAIGQYNLYPKARIAGWWALPPGGSAGLPQCLEAAGYEPSAMRWLAGDAGLVDEGVRYFPGAKVLNDGPTGTMAALNRLVAAVVESRQDLGLLVCQSGKGPILVTLVEP